MPQLLHRIAVMVACLLVIGTGVGRADVKLPGLFSDHMVLQRDRLVPIWGEAQPGEKVTVKFRNQKKTVIADEHGKWQVNLDPLTAGGPDPFIVTGSKTIEIEDVLVGEVWLCAGQSNIAMPVGWAIQQKDRGLAAAVAAAPYPQIRQFRATVQWQVADAKHLPDFTALPFAFALRLQKELGVPIGLMIGAVGGTGAGLWVTEEALQANPGYLADVKKFAATFDQAAELNAYTNAFAAYEKGVAEARTLKKAPPAPPCPPKIPGQAPCAKIGLHYEEQIRPLIPYALRGVLWDQGENGTGLFGVMNQTAVMEALIKSWRHDWGGGEFPFIFVQKPSGGGCAWDDNNPVTKDADPFIPLPAAVNGDPKAGGVETYIKLLAVPNTGMVSSSDLGAGTGNHPGNKSGYGYRAAGVALGMVYGAKVEYYGPLYSSHTINDNQVRVKFTHTGKGLVFKHGDKLQGFALAGADRVFYWADAQIEGDTVVLTSAKVSQPIAVSYAWAAQRAWANFFNQDGLPAIPFRTD